MEDKILKLTNAAYNLLEFFPDSEPLKNKAKEKALEIMDKRLAEDISLLLGYLWVAKNQGWISDMNYMIIAGEYGRLAEAIIGPKSQTTGEITSPAAAAGARNDETKKISLSGRKAKIIDFLQKKEKAQVVDLQTVLKNVTKRTIRRDLDELLSQKMIARFGAFNQVFYRINK